MSDCTHKPLLKYCDEIESERDALRAELESQKILRDEQFKALEIWKSRAEEVELKAKTYREALEKIGQGVDHPGGYREVPEFYDAIEWAAKIAAAALSEETEA